MAEGLVFIDLFMRSDKDYRSDVVLKKEMLGAMRRKGYNPKMVFDDRSSVVQMWRDEGLRVAQVAPGDF